VILGGEKATLDRQLTHGNLQNLIVRDFFHHRRGWMFMAVVIAVVVVRVSFAHLTPSLSYMFPVFFDSSRSQAGSNQCSGDSVCNVSLSNGYSSHRSF